MPAEVATTSLLEGLRQPGYRSSVIATYNCYFPFYEEVVLRRLVTAGCTHNVLLVDSAWCAEAYATEELRPQRAGRDYTLIPVRTAGAFHPKILLRLGKSKASLHVGSHNLTLSGFGLNDEISNAFTAEGAGIRAGAAPIRQALDYLSTFVPSGHSELLDAFEGVRRGIPWIEGPLGAGDPARQLLTSTNTGPDLWSQITPLIPDTCMTVFVCGPFFDPKLAMLRRLESEVSPQQLVVGIDPASVEIDPQEAASLQSATWVNVAGVPQIPLRREGAVPYLHAKLIWFQGGAEELLVTGSANPSIAAFFAPANLRNAEAVVADRRRGAAAELGMEALLAAPQVTDDEWQAIAVRRAASPTPPAPTSRRIYIAVPAPAGFRTHDPLPPGVVFNAISDSGLVLGEAVARDATAIEAAENVRASARHLESKDPGKSVLVVVHDPEEIARNIGGDTQKALRQALGALEEDPTQLETLLKLTEKVIFDSEDIVRSSPLRATGDSDSPATDSSGPASLALDALGKRAARRKRSIAGGDILVLIDALVRRLGEGLSPSTAARPKNDEEEIGADDEDGGELARPAPDFSVLAKACKSKVRRLINRLEAQFKLAAAPDKARRCIVQLAAVLGVVRALRVVEQRPEWRKTRLELVDRDDEWQLFETSVEAVAWSDASLAARALAEAGSEWFEELSMVMGLLAWLAWDVEVDAEPAASDSDWFPVQLLAALGPWLVGDDSAADVIADGVARTPRFGVDGSRWMRVHRSLLDAFAEVASAPDKHGTRGRRPEAGDLVVLPSGQTPRVRVILEVHQTPRGIKVEVWDRSSDKGTKQFMGPLIATLAWVPAGASARNHG